MASRIDEKTQIPLSSIAVLAGLIFAAAGVYYQGVSNAEAVEQVEQRQRDDKKEILDVVKEIRDDVKELNRKVDRNIRRGR